MTIGKKLVEKGRLRVCTLCIVSKNAILTLHSDKRAVRSSEGRVDSRPAALDKEVRSEPDTREALSAEPGSRQDVGGRPAPAHTMSAPAAPTQATSTPPALLPSSPYVPPQLAVPQGQFVGKSASLTQNMTTLAGATLSIPASNQPVLAPVQSTLGHPFEHSLTVPSVPLLSSVGQITLNTRYRYLVTREETYYEIRKKLIDVSQSTPKDKFFILKDQAAMANSILRLVEVRKTHKFLYMLLSALGMKLIPRY